MSTILDLKSLDALPESLRQRLDAHREAFCSETSLERLLERDDIRSIAQDLKEYLAVQRIRGYHCTKEPAAGFIETRGLRPTDAKAHQDEFLAAFSHLFADSEIEYMRGAWGADRARRNGQVWVCLSRSLVGTAATGLLHSYSEARSSTCHSGITQP